MTVRDENNLVRSHRIHRRLETPRTQVALHRKKSVNVAAAPVGVRAEKHIDKRRRTQKIRRTEAVNVSVGVYRYAALYRRTVAAPYLVRKLSGVGYTRVRIKRRIVADTVTQYDSSAHTFVPCVKRTVE